MTAPDLEPVRSLRYADGVLELLDQRQLPGRVSHVRCTTAEEVAAAIRDMVVRGAPAIGVAAAYGMALAAGATGSGTDASAAVERAGTLLMAARPTAVNLGSAVRRSLRILHTAPAAGLAALLAADAAALERFEVEASHAMGRLGAGLLPGRVSVLVHCNAGALATLERGTGLAPVFELHEQGRLAMVYVDETRPRLQGARLTAFELARAGIPHTLAVDSLAATLMRTGRVDAVLVGADRIAANGDVANKVGTYGLAVACAHHRLRLIVMAPTTTIDPSCPTGDGIPIEDRGADEVVLLGGERTAPAATPVLNPAFDITPAALVHALVTEAGIASPVTEEAVARLVEGAAAR